MVLQLRYKYGWNAGAEVGYKIKDMAIILNLNYSEMKYQSITDDHTGEDAVGWGSDVSGKSRFIYSLVSGEYILPIIDNKYIHPFVSLGIGFARSTDVIKDSKKEVDRSQIVFAYKFKVGINYNFTRQLQANIGTSFFGTSKIKATDHYLKQWQFINLGVRWVFN